MTTRIILNIRHSDNYTDYIFMTACLTNRQVVPLLDPSPAEVKAQSDAHTVVLGCFNSRKVPGPGDSIASYDTCTHNIRVLSRYYLAEDGSVNPAKAEIARSVIQETIKDILLSSDNIHEVYRRNFPLLWTNKEAIYSNPLFFYAKTGVFNTTKWDFFPLGVVLKTIEEDDDLFRSRRWSGCECGQSPLIIDYEETDGNSPQGFWILHTWCPRCRSRREIRVESIDCYESRLTSTHCSFDMKKGLSPLTLFDVIEQLSEAK